MYKSKRMQVHVATAGVGKVDSGLTVGNGGRCFELGGDVAIVDRHPAKHFAADRGAKLERSAAVSVYADVEAFYGFNVEILEAESKAFGNVFDECVANIAVFAVLRNERLSSSDIDLFFVAEDVACDRSGIFGFVVQ